MTSLREPDERDVPPAGSEDTFTRGAKYVETYRRPLADGKLHVELLLPDGRRRGLTLWPDDATPENLEKLAEAMHANRAKIAGRNLKTTL